MSGLLRPDWERLYHGTCPRCREHKFLGHGPLCVECLCDATPDPATPTRAGLPADRQETS